MLTEKIKHGTFSPGILPEAEYDAYDANGDNDLLQAGKGIRNNIEVCYEHDHDSKFYEVKVTEPQTTDNLSLIR